MHRHPQRPDRRPRSRERSKLRVLSSTTLRHSYARLNGISRTTVLVIGSAADVSQLAVVTVLTCADRCDHPTIDQLHRLLHVRTHHYEPVLRQNVRAAGNLCGIGLHSEIDDHAGAVCEASLLHGAVGRYEYVAEHLAGGDRLVQLAGGPVCVEEGVARRGPGAVLTG